MTVLKVQDLLANQYGEVVQFLRDQVQIRSRFNATSHSSDFVQNDQRTSTALIHHVHQYTKNRERSKARDN